MPEVRPATAAELPAVGRVLAAAFAGDPVWDWLVSPRADWPSRAAAFYASEARLRLGLGDRDDSRVLVQDQLHGAALWAAPGRWRTTWRQTLGIAVPSIRLFGTGVLRGLNTMSVVQRHHPVAPHWYLAYLGTEPAHQGRGIASALIAPVTERCDVEGLGAYLESSKEANLAFYARHGFEVRDRIDLAGGPPMWPMWREPKT